MAVGLLFIASAASRAASANWSGAANRQWSNPTNWAEGVVPATGADIYFGNPSTIPIGAIDLGSGATVSSLHFSKTFYALGTGAYGSQSLTLLDGGSVSVDGIEGSDFGYFHTPIVNAAIILGENAGAADYYIKSPFVSTAPISGGTGGMSGAKTLHVSRPKGDIFFNAPISDGGSSSLSVSFDSASQPFEGIQYASYITLGGKNTYTGSTTVGQYAPVALVVSDAISQLSRIVLDGGKIENRAEEQHFGSIVVSGANSMLTFEWYPGADISFMDSHDLAWDGNLIVTGFRSSADSLRFGTDSTGLTPEQISRITVRGYYVLGLDEGGYLKTSLIPEPGSISLCLVGIPAAVFVSRRRLTSPFVWLGKFLVGPRIRVLAVLAILFMPGVKAFALYPSWNIWNGQVSNDLSDLRNWKPATQNDQYKYGITIFQEDTQLIISQPFAFEELSFQYPVPQFIIGENSSQILRMKRGGGITFGGGRTEGEINTPIVFNASLILEGSGHIERGSGVFLGPVTTDSSGIKRLSIDSVATLEFHGLISDGAGQVSLDIMTSRSVILFAPNTYTGPTGITESTLDLRVSNALSPQSKITMTIDAGILTNGVDQNFGTLRLFNGECFLDFGTGDSDVTFADSHLEDWYYGGELEGKLTLLNFDIGIDSLRFGTNNLGLTSAQLNRILLPGYTTGIDSNGFLVFTPAGSSSAVPEPGACALFGFGSLGLAVCAILTRKFRVVGGS